MGEVAGAEPQRELRFSWEAVGSNMDVWVCSATGLAVYDADRLLNLSEP